MGYTKHCSLHFMQNMRFHLVNSVCFGPGLDKERAKLAAQPLRMKEEASE